MVQHYDYGDTDTAPNDATQRYEEARAAARQAMTRATADATPQVVEDLDVDPAYRGFKFGAAFFGWLIAVSMTVLIAGVIGSIATGVGAVVTITWSDVEQRAGTVGIIAAVVLVLMVSLAFYTGGYVAGRLARFDGTRQGFGVWMFALVITVIAAGLGALADTQYDLAGRINPPNVPLPNDTLTTGAVSAAATMVVLTLLAALLGGRTGQRYHDKIDDLMS